MHVGAMAELTGHTAAIARQLHRQAQLLSRYGAPRAAAGAAAATMLLTHARARARGPARL